MATGASFTRPGRGRRRDRDRPRAPRLDRAPGGAHYEIAPQGCSGDRALRPRDRPGAASSPRCRRACPRRAAEMRRSSTCTRCCSTFNLSVVPRELIGNRRCNAELGARAADDYLVAPIRRDGRPVPARAQTGHRAGRRARVEGDARHRARARAPRTRKTSSSSRTLCRPRT